MVGKLFVACKWVIPALADVGNKVTKSQCHGSIFSFRVALGTSRLSPHVSGREVYDIVQYIYLFIYPYIANKENQRGIDTSRKVEKKRRFFNKGSIRLEKGNQGKGGKLRDEIVSNYCMQNSTDRNSGVFVHKF